MRPRLAGFVITHRRPGELERTLETLLAQTRPPESLLVVDNGSSAETAEVAAGFASRGVAYLDAGDNLGPPGAAALALGRLLDGPWDWIYWGDDDDPPRTADTFERLLALASNERGGDAGALGAVGAPWDWRRGRLARLPDEALRGPVEVDVVAGGSQLLLAAGAARRVGLPEPRLFFALEDLEYCLRLRRAGYRVLVDGDLMRTYRELAGRLNLRTSRLRRRQDDSGAPWRQYYSTRNYIFMMRRTFDRPDLARRCAARAAAKGLAAWTRGLRHGLESSRLQLRAVFDGYRDRMGRTLEPPTEGAR